MKACLSYISSMCLIMISDRIVGTLHHINKIPEKYWIYIASFQKVINRNYKIYKDKKLIII